MFLERIEIRGFRGIKRLSLSLNTRTVIIGENAWGKTSLLRCLWCLLGNGNIPYEFTDDDFFYSNLENNHKEESSIHSKSLSIILTFREVQMGSAMHFKRLSQFKPFWIKGNDAFCHLNYYAGANMDEHGVIFTSHGFLDKKGNLHCHGYLSLVQNLLALNPVFRVRDSRSVMGAVNGENETIIPDKPDFLDITDQRLEKLFKSVSEVDGENINRTMIKEGVVAVQALVRHYFSVMPGITSLRHENIRTISDMVNRPVSSQSFGSLKAILSKSGPKKLQTLMAIIAGAIIHNRGKRVIARGARPIVLFEDIEGRLHPSVLINVWNILDMLPMQLMLTTNSGDLLSCVDLRNIRRMARKPGITQCYAINESKFTYDDLRKIAFHIRLNRPMTLFAKVWLFVEGETEIWIINEFASILNISLAGSGVRIVEFAQCGVMPLIRFADQLGIAWHMMADHDEAGIKYAAQAESLGGIDKVHLLPGKDIEHFLYENGFENVYRKNLPQHGLKGMNENHIIETSLKRYSKPGMALAVADDARKRGNRVVPQFFKLLFSKLLSDCQ